MEENRCFICFEVSNQYENTPSKLSDNIHFLKNCQCDGWVHDFCIEKWYYFKEICPICRNRIIYVNFEFHYMLDIINFYFYIFKNITTITRRLHFFLKIYIFYTLTNYMFQIILNATSKFNKNDLEHIYYNQEYTYYNLENMCYNYTAPQIL
jgi:hypothetical protein